MRIIAHRGNLDGPSDGDEGYSERVHNALSEGFDVEIDVWWFGGEFWMGHDQPMFLCRTYLIEHDRTWVHAKNGEALYHLSKTSANVFYHEDDPFVLTSKGYLWVHPRTNDPASMSDRSVLVLPERRPGFDFEWWSPGKCYAVCTDLPRLIKSRLEKMACLTNQE